MEDRKIVIIPTYNERENIENIIRKVFSLDGGYDILIIDALTGPQPSSKDSSRNSRKGSI